MIELISGNLLFPTHENFEHLAMIEKISGKIPSWMGEDAQDKSKKYFNKNPNTSKYELNWPSNSPYDSIERVNKLQTLA
jgi:hypothetical protein